MLSLPRVRRAESSPKRGAGGGPTPILLLLILLGVAGRAAFADLADYDAVLRRDAAAGIVPASSMTEAVTLAPGTRAFWNFGDIPGNATFEFILMGDPASQSAYLAVGTNATSNLRFAQWPGTGRLGFTQLGVRDYSFSPSVPTPTQPTHIVYAWDAAGRVMRAYRNGDLAGTASGVDPAFGMPTGAGRLGANPSGTEAMTGTIHRLVTYGTLLPAELIRAHAHAYLGITPRPAVASFSADRAYFREGDAVELRWITHDATRVTISPEPGDVTSLTTNGSGTLRFHPTASRSLTLQAALGDLSDEAVLRLHRITPAEHPVLSEIVADDRSVLADEDGEHSGWIEIFNPTAAAVNLAGWALADDPDRPGRWLFPSTNLAPGSFLVVHASNKDRRVAGRPLHTDFALRNSGEYLALISPDGGTRHAFAPTYPAQGPDAAYGLHGGDVATAGRLAFPSPGQPNPDQATPPGEVLATPAGGTFTNTVTVTLRSPDPDARIWFTVDGSEPSPTRGTRYTDPLTLSRTTRVRARAESQGLLGPVSGAVFIRLVPELAQYTSPLPILVIDNFAAGVIPQKGWNPTGAGLRQVPRETAVWAAFERNAGTAHLLQPPQMMSLIGIRGRGAYSTEWRQKPYSVEAIDEAGAEKDVSPLNLPAHPDWVLYYPDADPSRDPTLLFNTFAYDLSQAFGDYAVRFRWVEVFINEDGGDLSLAHRRGVYALMERVARGTERLDFRKLSDDGATGGWLLNINRMDPEPEHGWPAANGATQPWFFHTAGPNRRVETSPNTAYATVPGDDQPQQPNAYINFDNPNGYTITPTQRAAIEAWFTRFEDVLYDDSRWLDPQHGYRSLIDVRDFIDYFILNTLTRNGDGLLISMYPWKGDDGRLRMGPAWDYNWASYYVSGPPTGSLLHRSDRLWYARLFTDPDFNQDYVDRWWELRAGPLSNNSMNGILDRQATEITPAKALLNGLPTTAEWSRRVTQMKSWLHQRADWIDAQYVPPPSINHPGGEVEAGFGIVLSSPTGAIYFTTDGTDPRAPGGNVAPSARHFTTPIPVQGPTQIRARVRQAQGWSGLRSATFGLPNPLRDLAISELMYHPPASPPWSDDELEFVELQNRGPAVLDLGGAAFASGIAFVFTNGTRLDPGAYLVLAHHAAAFHALHPTVPLHGVYTGKLANEGEPLRLDTASGEPGLTFEYDDQAPWPVAADGAGRSLVPREDPFGAPPGPAGLWRASTLPGGSPGLADPPVFTAHPLSQEAAAGQGVTLSVGVHRGLTRPVEIRWLRNGVPMAAGTRLDDGEFAFQRVGTTQRPDEYRVLILGPDHPEGLYSLPATVTPVADRDADGMPDAWETAHGQDPGSAADRTDDPDHDGSSNLDEYLAGTDPRNGADYLGLEVESCDASQLCALRVRTAPFRTYAIEASDSLEGASWVRIAALAAESTPKTTTVPIAGTTPLRFFRLVTPCPP